MDLGIEELHALAARRPQRRLHFFPQDQLDHFPHPLPNGRLQPLSQRTLLARFCWSAALRHGVFLLCP